ncbi:hypothetical protein GSH05_15895 [Burkholderia pseudomallei]|nr:hypothetical protein [Burkholderia pseudomallei]
MVVSSWNEAWRTRRRRLRTYRFVCLAATNRSKRAARGRRLRRRFEDRRGKGDFKRSFFRRRVAGVRDPRRMRAAGGRERFRS